MNRRLDDGSRRPDAPPWALSGQSLAGRAGFSDSITVRAAFVSGAPARFGGQPSRGTEVKPGLTRRGMVYEYIRAHPGAHVRGMAKELSFGTGDLQYHLFWLEKNGFVKTRKNGFYRFVYPTMMFREEQEVLLGVLSQETPREILLCLLWDRTMTQGDLARSLGHSQPTISWHMDRLFQLGLVSKKRTSRGVVYAVAADRHDILSFVESYYPGVWKRWAGRFESLAVSAGVERVDNGGPARRTGFMPAAVVELIGHS
jgi:DNA-binding MarR family transcriptional regulator